MHVCGLLVGAAAHDLPGTAAGKCGAGLGSHAAAVLCGGSHGPGQPAPACSGPTAALSCPSWGPGCVCSLCARYVCEGAVHALTGCLQPGDAPAAGCDRAAVNRVVGTTPWGAATPATALHGHSECLGGESCTPACLLLEASFHVEGLYSASAVCPWCMPRHWLHTLEGSEQRPTWKSRNGR